MRPLSKFDAFVFFCAIFLCSIFYGVLNFFLLSGVFTSYISAFIRLVIFVCAAYLMLKDLFYYKYQKITPSVISLIIYAFLAMFMIAIYRQTEFSLTNGLGNSSLSLLYVFFAYSLTYTMLYAMSEKRFEFFVRKCSIAIYSGALIATLVVVILARDILISDADISSIYGINRHTIKEPIMLLFTISLAWVLFPKNIIYFILGGIGGLLSLYGIYVSTSQSSIISAVLILGVGTFIALFRGKAYSRGMSILVIGITVFVGIPLFLLSKGGERLSKLVEIGNYYTFGGAYDTSRIDLVMGGMNKFLESPIIGGNAYLPNGSYTHFFPVDILMSTGIIGFILASIMAIGIIKGIVIIYKGFSTNAAWVIMLCVFSVSQACFHGSLSSIIGMGFVIPLFVNMNYNNKCY